MTDLTFRMARQEDADRCFQIEVASYEGDEAATLAKIRLRISQYPEGFLILEADGEIAGFINSGCAFDVVMSDEAFKELIGHDAQAPNVVIMSVVGKRCKGPRNALMTGSFAEGARPRLRPWRSTQDPIRL